MAYCRSLHVPLLSYSCSLRVRLCSSRIASHEADAAVPLRTTVHARKDSKAPHEGHLVFERTSPASRITDIASRDNSSIASP